MCVFMILFTPERILEIFKIRIGFCSMLLVLNRSLVMPVISCRMFAGLLIVSRILMILVSCDLSFWHWLFWIGWC